MKALNKCLVIVLIIIISVLDKSVLLGYLSDLRNIWEYLKLRYHGIPVFRAATFLYSGSDNIWMSFPNLIWPSPTRMGQADVEVQGFRERFRLLQYQKILKFHRIERFQEFLNL
jgi:hypothetical protein